MNKKLQLKKLITEYAIYNVERSLTLHADPTDRQRAELRRLDIKCAAILSDLTKIIDEL